MVFCSVDSVVGMEEFVVMRIYEDIGDCHEDEDLADIWFSIWWMGDCQIKNDIKGELEKIKLWKIK